MEFSAVRKRLMEERLSRTWTRGLFDLGPRLTPGVKARAYVN
jgi:hypothetical protein